MELTNLFHTLFVYGLLITCMMCIIFPLANLNNDNIIFKNEKTVKFIGIVLLSALFGVIFGMRWDVGTDNLEYLRIYIQNDTSRYENEFLFKLLNDFGHAEHIHYSIYFTIFAFAQIFLLFYTLRKESYLWPFLILSLFGGHFFIDWMNAMRQEMASCIMLFATNYIIEKKPLKYLLCTIFAVGFHSSAVIFLLVYPILSGCKNLVPKIWIQLFLLIICVGITIVVGDILSKCLPFLDLLQQMEYAQDYANKYNANVLQKYSDMQHVGIMFYVFFVLNVIIIINSNKIKACFEGKRIMVYYNLYYWGIIFETILYTNMVLIRPFRYFRIYKLIIIAYLLSFLYRKHTLSSFVTFVFIIFILLACILIISYTKPFNFFFEIPYAP